MGMISLIDEDLDEDVDETIQHYARKKRETSKNKVFMPAIVIIIILVVLILYFII
jgi:t-SNARE complex subunit (syntaxin)